MRNLCSLFFITAAFCVGCGSWGGGGGEYYPPKVNVNNISLMRRAMSTSDIASYETIFVFDDNHDEWVRDRKKASEESLRILGKRFFDIYKFQYLNKKYVLALDSNAIIFDENSHEVRRLNLPRYPIQGVVFSIKLRGEDYLVIYIDQQATSHSSTLFVLNRSFDIEYQEHLLAAKEVGRGHSGKYGHFFVLKSEGFWFPDGLKNPEVRINGDWLYYLNDRR